MLLMTLAVAAATVGLWQGVHRSSSLVRRWHPSSFPRSTAGPLSVRDSGPTGRPDEEAVVLLHGLGATGDYFGAFYDGLSPERRVVIVDLLGFGHSLDVQRDDFDLDDHVDALDQALDALGLGASRVVLAAHSMSTAIALSWANRNPHRTQHVYLWGPPIYPNATAAQSVASEYGFMGRLFALDTKWAERACRVNCLDRDLSGKMMALMSPRWPTGISGDASQHTWAAYHLSLRNLILDMSWSKVLPANIPLTIFHGSLDSIGDQQHIAKIARNATRHNVVGADHHVALQHPELLVNALERR